MTPISFPDIAAQASSAQQVGKRAERAGFVRLAITPEPARTGKFQVPKQSAEHHGMPVLMPELLATVRTSLPGRQISRQLLLNNLSLQGGQQGFGLGQGDAERFEPFGFPFQANQFLDLLTRFLLSGQLNLEFHGGPRSV